jgi:hypothetical protein
LEGGEEWIRYHNEVALEIQAEEDRDVRRQRGEEVELAWDERLIEEHDNGEDDEEGEDEEGDEDEEEELLLDI